MAVDFVKEARLAPDPATARQRARLAGLLAGRDGQAAVCPFDEPELAAAWRAGLEGRPKVALPARTAGQRPARPAVARRGGAQGRRQWWQDL